MTRNEKAKKIGKTLDKLYPETPIPLNHSSAYTLIVAVMLSAQTTDKKVNQVTPALFKRANTPAKMAPLKAETIQNIFHSYSSNLRKFAIFRIVQLMQMFTSTQLDLVNNFDRIIITTSNL